MSCKIVNRYKYAASFIPDEDKNFEGTLVLDFRKWWRLVKTIYYKTSVSRVRAASFLNFVTLKLRELLKDHVYRILLVLQNYI